MPRTSINRPILEAALIGLENQKQKIEEQIAEIRKTMGGNAPRAKAAAAKSGKALAPAAGVTKKRSVAARKRMAAAQKRRWAAWRKEQGV